MTRRLTLAIVCLSALLVLLVRASSGAMLNPFLDYDNLGMWVAAALTIFALSFLYGDNPLYRFTEHVFVGVTAAYWMVLGFWNTLVPKLLAVVAPELVVSLFGMDFPLDVPFERRLFYCLPLIMGILLLLRLLPRGRRFSAWPLAFIVGTAAGLRLIAFLDASFLAQIHNTITPLFVVGENGFDLARTFDSLLLTGGVICCLFYFYFCRRDNGFRGKAGKAGLWILMVTFGASFGFTVMGRIALLVGRVEFLLKDWLRFI
ncbi:MAG: hypothetical protein ABIF77_11830 [bacterium]